MGIDFDIDKIESVKQKGDLYTKGFQGESFWRIRKIMWLVRLVQLPSFRWEGV